MTCREEVAPPATFFGELIPDRPAPPSAQSPVAAAEIGREQVEEELVLRAGRRRLDRQAVCEQGRQAVGQRR